MGISNLKKLYRCGLWGQENQACRSDRHIAEHRLSLFAIYANLQKKNNKTGNPNTIHTYIT